MGDRGVHLTIRRPATPLRVVVEIQLYVPIPFTPVSKSDSNGALDVLSAALDAGTAVGAILVFFVLQYPGNGSIGRTTIEQWWGNSVWRQTADMRGVPFKTLADSGRDHFGYVPPPISRSRTSA